MSTASLHWDIGKIYRVTSFCLSWYFLQKDPDSWENPNFLFITTLCAGKECLRISDKIGTHTDPTAAAACISDNASPPDSESDCLLPLQWGPKIRYVVVICRVVNVICKTALTVRDPFKTGSGCRCPREVSCWQVGSRKMALTVRSGERHEIWIAATFHCFPLMSLGFKIIKVLYFWFGGFLFISIYHDYFTKFR